MPSKAKQDALVRQWYPLAEKLASQYVGRNPGLLTGMRDDLVSAGLEGLAQAARTYDPRKGAAFSGHAYRRIRGSIIDYVRKQDHVSRHGREKERAAGKTPARLVSIEKAFGHADRMADATNEDVTDLIARKERIAEVEAAVEALPEALRTALVLRFGAELNLKQIGEALGYTESRACQAVHEAVAGIRAALGPRNA